MKMSKNIVLLSITIVTLIGLVAIATYSYFTASVNVNNKITTSAKLPKRPTFAVSGGGELALTVTRNLTLKENAYSGNDNWEEGKNYLEAIKNLTVTLTGEPGTTCTYNIYYKDTSPDSTIIESSDFSIDIWKNESRLFGIYYVYFKQTSAGTAKTTAFFGGSSYPFNNAKPVITIPSGSTTAAVTWSFVMHFYNENRDQSYLANKTFKGELYVGDVSCT